MLKKIPNILTIGRILIVPFFVLAFYLPGFYGDLTALILFIVASFTDFLNEMFDSHLNDVITIRYNRSYLKHPSGIRLTLDKDLTYKLPRSNIKKSLDFEVVEFKYDINKDDYFRKILFHKFSDLPLRLTKCSKYVEAITSEYSY